MLGIDSAAILDTVEAANRLPALKVGHGRILEQVDAYLDVHGGNLGLTGNWFSGVSIEDSLIRTRAEFQRLFAVQSVT